MIKYTLRYMVLSLALLAPWVMFAIPKNQILNESVDVSTFLNDKELSAVLKDSNTTYAYIPNDVLASLRAHSRNPHVLKAIRSATPHIISYDVMIDAVGNELKGTSNDSYRKVLESYNKSLDSGDAAIVLPTRGGNKILCSLIVKNCLKARNLVVSGNAAIGGNLDVSGEISGQSLNISGNANIGGNENIGGNLNVGGNETIGGNLTVKGTINGHINPADLCTDGALNLPCNLTVNGNETITGNLLVEGNETINGNLHVHGSETIDKNLHVKGTITGHINPADLCTNGALNLPCNLTVNNETVNHNLTVNGNTNLNNLAVNNNITFNNSNTTLNVIGSSSEKNLNVVEGVIQLPGGGVIGGVLNPLFILLSTLDPSLVNPIVFPNPGLSVLNGTGLTGPGFTVNRNGVCNGTPLSLSQVRIHFDKPFTQIPAITATIQPQFLFTLTILGVSVDVELSGFIEVSCFTRNAAGHYTGVVLNNLIPNALFLSALPLSALGLLTPVLALSGILNNLVGAPNIVHFHAIGPVA